MQYKKTLPIIVVSLMGVLLLFFLYSTKTGVSPRTARVDFQLINIAQQQAQSDQIAEPPAPIPEPIEDAVEDPVEEVSETHIEPPVVEPDPIEPVIEEPAYQATVTPPKPKKITKAIVAPLETKSSSSPTIQPVKPISQPTQANQKLVYNYEHQLSAWLEKYKRYPAIAQRRAYQGLVVVKFSINNEGLLLDYKIIQPSKYKSLNNAVVKMLKRATPMPAIPKEIRTSQGYYEYEIPVRFELNQG